jgi:hypothetical protein
MRRDYNDAPTTAMYVQRQRPLSDAEARRLRKQIAQLQTTIREIPKNSLGCLAGLSLLCVLVFAIKPGDPVNRWGALILFGVFILIAAASGLQSARELRRSLRELERAIEAGTVEEHHVVSDRCLKVEDDIGDHGNYYYFDVGAQGTFLLSDQDVDLNGKKLPNSDFTLTHTLSETGRLLDMRLRTAGERITPDEVFLLTKVEVDPGPDGARLLPESFDAVRETLAAEASV